MATVMADDMMYISLAVKLMSYAMLSTIPALCPTQTVISNSPRLHYGFGLQ